ncbi:MAG: PASTA domain-containing protein, partial [Solirubrobacteraceae bacterium]
CTVPKLGGLTLARAKAKLAKAHCAIGRVTRKATKTKRKVGRVLSQAVKSGVVKTAGAKVGVTVGRKPR